MLFDVLAIKLLDCWTFSGKQLGNIEIGLGLGTYIPPLPAGKGHRQ
jgi:hypothetical protein